MRKIRSLVRGLLCLVAVALAAPAAMAAPGDDGRALLEALDTRAYADKGEAIEALAASGDPRTRRWLEALMDGKLQRHKDTGRFVVVLENRGRHWPVADALSLEPAGEMSRRELDRIGINNALRGRLQGTLAVLDLRVEDAGARREAARDLLGRVDAAMVVPLEGALEDEGDAEVRRLLAQGLAIHRLEQGEAAAIEALAGSSTPRPGRP